MFLKKRIDKFKNEKSIFKNVKSYVTNITLEAVNKKDDSSPNLSVEEATNVESPITNVETIDEQNINETMEKTMENEQTNVFAKAIEDLTNVVKNALPQAKSESEVVSEIEAKLSEANATIASLEEKVQALENDKTELASKVAEFETKEEEAQKAIAEKEEELVQAQYVARAKDEFSHLLGTPEEIAVKLRTIDAIEDEATKETVLNALKNQNKENESLCKEQGTEASTENDVTEAEKAEAEIYAKAEELMKSDSELSLQQAVYKIRRNV